MPYERYDGDDSTRAAIQAVQRHGREAAEKVSPPTGVSVERWRAMCKQIQLYGPPTSFQEW